MGAQPAERARFGVTFHEPGLSLHWMGTCPNSSRARAAVSSDIIEAMRIYDLTRALEPGMPVYPGDPPVHFEAHADYPGAGFRVTALSLGTHAGTHLDAPSHFLP